MSEQGTGKRPRRARGEGMLRQLPSGTWEGRARIDGKQRSVYGRTKTEAARKMRELRQEAAAGRDVARKRQKVKAWLSYWLEEVAKPRVSAKTMRYYRQQATKIEAGLGHLWLDDLKTADVQGWLNRLADGGLSPRSVAAARNTLRACLTDAERQGLVSRNVAKLAQGPAVEEPAVSCLSADQALRLVEATADDALGPLFATALGTGMRIGELLGLRWVDVDFEAGTIRVEQSLKSLPGEPVFGPPKSAQSRRTLPMAGMVAKALRVQRDRQAFARRAAGDLWRDFGLVFAAADGWPLRFDTTRKTLRRAQRAAGVPETRMHDLRHSAASILIAQGVPLAKVSRILGHSQIGVTADYYGHLQTEDLRQDADVLGRALSRPESA